MRVVAIVPAYQAAKTIGALVTELGGLWPARDDVIVVDDGSADATAQTAAEAGAVVVRHRCNRGKGAALRTGMAWARHRGATHAVTLDADGQHPPTEAWRLATLPVDQEALVLGIRDLAAAGAPRANQHSNGISNYWLSLFSRQRLQDTQCGLRRYPLAAALALGGQALGFGYEAEIVLRAARSGLPLVQEPVRVVYPPERERSSHFHAVRDPSRIVVRVLATWALAARHP